MTKLNIQTFFLCCTINLYKKTISLTYSDFLTNKKKLSHTYKCKHVCMHTLSFPHKLIINYLQIFTVSCSSQTELLHTLQLQSCQPRCGPQQTRSLFFLGVKLLVSGRCPAQNPTIKSKINHTLQTRKNNNCYLSMIANNKIEKCKLRKKSNKYINIKNSFQCIINKPALTACSLSNL